MNDQIADYMLSHWVFGLVAVSIIAALVAMGITWVFATFFETFDRRSEHDE